jgi:hypothetical protein
VLASLRLCDRSAEAMGQAKFFNLAATTATAFGEVCVGSHD